MASKGNLPKLPTSRASQPVCNIITSIRTKMKKVKSFLSLKAHRVEVISISSVLSQTPVYTARPRTQSQHITRYACVYVSALAGTECAYP